MAKSKTIKAAPAVKAAASTDFTFRNPVNAVIRLNSACVLELNADTEQQSVSVILTDEVTGKKYQGIANLEEVA